MTPDRATPRLDQGEHARNAEPMTRDPELMATARTLASLALERVRQDGDLRVRQGELLRRALTSAATSLGWDTMPGSGDERVATARRDLAELADAGAELLETEVVAELSGKKEEVQRIQEVARSVQELGEDAAVSYPTQVEYSLTVRNGLGGLVTKTEVLVLNDSAEALHAAATIEKRLVTLEKLRTQMVGQLKDRQALLQTMRTGLPGFVESSDRLLVELLAS